jgi:hypothetical protein
MRKMLKIYLTVEYGKYTDYLKEWEKEIQNGVTSCITRT